MTDIAYGISQAWIIWGNFNALLHSQDRLFRNPVVYSEIKEFSECVQELLLNKLNWMGDYYTWTNKQLGNDRICNRLDIAFGNHEWMIKWGHTKLIYDLPSMSDHSPMILELHTYQRNLKVPFRFFNVWADHKDFIPRVQDIWHIQIDGTNMYKLWEKLKKLKVVLKQLNTTEFKTTFSKYKKQELI